MRNRSIIFALTFLVSSPAVGQSPAELRDLASNFGLTPQQARHVFALYDAQSSRIVGLAAANKIDKRLLRSAALRLGATNPNIGAQDFLRLVEGTADKAARAQAKIERLESLVAALQVGEVRTQALAGLQEGRKAFDDGRFEDAGRAFARLESLRQSDLAAVREAWKESVFAQMDVLALAGRNEQASALAQRAAKDVMDQARHDSWEFAIADAQQWADRGGLFLDNAALQRSITILGTQALALAPQDAAPLDWAETQNKLGNVLVRLGERTGATNLLEEAVTAQRAALQKVPRESAPTKWAAIKLDLCGALYQLGTRRGERRLTNEGLNHCASTLEATLESGEITDEAGWKKARKNVGVALLRLGAENYAPHQVWIDTEALQMALEEYDRDKSPVEWAIAQSKFADILVAQELSHVSSASSRAIEHYRLALKELTRERAPMDWARSQNGLGNALQKVAADDWATDFWDESPNPVEGGPPLASQRDLLEEAATAYRLALDVYRRDQAPLYWAMVQRNLARVLARLTDRYDEYGEKVLAQQRFEGSVAAYRAAIEGYSGAGARAERIKTQADLGCYLGNFEDYLDAAAVVLEAVVKESPSGPGKWDIGNAQSCLRNLQNYRELRNRAIESPTAKP